jgi:hypothetical protein
MKTKFLIFSAIIFLLLGINSKEGVLFFFFAIHLFTLSVGVIFLKFDKRLQPKPSIDIQPPAESSES